MWVDYRGSLSTVYNDGEITVCTYLCIPIPTYIRSSVYNVLYFELYLHINKCNKTTAHRNTLTWGSGLVSFLRASNRD